MSKEGIENIKNLLTNIIIFDDEYKNNILNKATNLDEEGLSKIHGLLSEVETWQRRMIEKKLKADPSLLNRLEIVTANKKKSLNQIKREFLAESDKEKITKVLSFIDKL